MYATAIATNHEWCFGKINSDQDYEMDMHNNAKGREMRVQFVNNNQCGDTNKMIQTALANLPILRYYKPAPIP